MYALGKYTNIILLLLQSSCQTVCLCCVVEAPSSWDPQAVAAHFGVE